MTQAPPEDEPGRAQRVLKSVGGGFGATATVITGVLGVVFLLLPGVRPLPRDKIEASLSIPTIERSVTVSQWARRQYPGDPDAALRRLLKPDTRAERSQRGTVVYVRLNVDGFKRRSIKLRARVYDVKTRQSPPVGTAFERIYPRADELTIDAPSRSSLQLILLDDLTDLPSEVFVRVEAYDDDGILAYADSGKISTDGVSVSEPPPQ